LALIDIILTGSNLPQAKRISMAEEKKEAAAPAAKEKEKAAAPAPAAPTGKSNPLVALLLLLNAAGLGFVGFMQFQNSMKWAKEPSVVDIVKSEVKAQAEANGENKDSDSALSKKLPEGLLLPLKGFTANLAQGDGPRRFLRLNAVLRFSKDSKAEEFKNRKPQIRDSIISILNSKRPEDVLSEEGKLFLKEEIKSSINSFLVEGSVVDVYYVGFQIN